MKDLKTTLHNARIRLLRRPSRVESKSQQKKASLSAQYNRRSASLSKLPSLQVQHVQNSSTTSSGHDQSPEGVTSTTSDPLDHEVRQHSAETIVDSQNGALQSLSSKDLQHVPLESSVVSIPSSDSNDSSKITPVLTLQEPSPPEIVPFALTPPSAMSGTRKIWVKRPNASATLVKINRDDLVDDVRDMILSKYANSLGRSFDSPDVTLRIVPREHQRAQDRTLGPEEEICKVIDAFFPGGQTVDEALIIDVPQRRTPKPSPRGLPHHISSYYDETARPLENGGDYFPPMPITIAASPAAMTNNSHDSRASHQERAMSILTTGHAPTLPSPGGRARKNHHLHEHRPKLGRHHTSSPTTMAATAMNASAIRPRGTRHDSNTSESIAGPPPTSQPLPTPPAPVDQPNKAASTPPIPRVSSPRPTGKSRKRSKASAAEAPSLTSSLLDNSVPPINVLIVEDNMINLRVLGAFMERLKVRWQRAMNGREAVTKWRAGGFHLVLMDIQLPIMNGLEATKEIRRLEKVNSIGVFSSASNDAPAMGPEGGSKEICAADRLGDALLFKSPVIIVALTASSLQSDRHEALAAGCNDFLTKPVNFLWLERKVKEWGCMQALIDFDGWRKWKDFAAQSDSFKDKNGTTGKKKGLKKVVEDHDGKSSGHEAENSSAS